MRIGTALAVGLIWFGATVAPVFGVTKYWDVDQISQAGAGGPTPSGLWTPTSNAHWNVNADGTGLPTTWTSGDIAVFAAGTDAIGAYTVTSNPTLVLSGLIVEEGTVTQSGGTLDFSTTPDAPINGNWIQSITNSIFGSGGIIASGHLSFGGGNNFYRAGSGSQAFLTAQGIVDFSFDTNLGKVPTTTDNPAALLIDGGTLRFIGSSATALAANRGVTVSANNGTIEVVNATTLSLPAGAPAAAAFSGSGTLTKTGVGRLSLNTNQTTFTGKYIVKNGSISFPSDGVFGAVPAAEVADYFTLDGGGLVSTFSNGVILNSKRGIKLGANGGFLMGNQPGPLTFGGIVSGNQGGGLRIAVSDGVGITTSAAVSLTNANTYDGATQIDPGAFLIVNNLTYGGITSAIGQSSNAASNLVFNGGTLWFDGSGAITDRNFTVTAAGGAIKASSNGGGVLTFLSTSLIAMSGTGPRTFTLDGISTGNNTMSLGVVDQGANATTLVKTGPGVWVLTNASNSYTGNTQVQEGTLKLGAAGVIPDASLVTLSQGSGPPTFDLNGFNETVRSVSGTVGTIALGTKTLTLNSPNGESYSGAITGAGGGKIIKNGTGKLTLSPTTGTYDGGLTLNGGALGAGNVGALGSGTLVINNSITLSAASNNPIRPVNPVTLSGNLTFDDSFTATPGQFFWITNAANKWTITGGNRTIGVNTLAGGYQVTINQIIAQDIAGRGLTKTGNGALTLAGVNTYTGDTKVLGGTLSISNAYLANAADVYLTTGSTFNLNFTGTDVVDSLFVDGFSRAIGTWGAPGSGATYQSSLFTGSGLLQVTTFVPSGVAGDFNNDGKVDAGDYLAWRKNNNTNNALPNDTGLGTPIGNLHYKLWRSKFGNISGSGSGVGDAAAVPECLSAALLTIGLAGLTFVRHNRRFVQVVFATNRI